jgi:membrane-associated progesterone receptor component
MLSLLIYALVLLLPAVYLSFRHFRHSQTHTFAREPERKETAPKTIMQAPRDDLAPAKDDPFTVEELKQFDGNDPTKPIYVAIKSELERGYVYELLYSLVGGAGRHCV